MQLFDTIVIGAGQYGLYTAKKLADKNINYLVLEANTVGEVWRKRLKTMTLFTSRQYSAMPGLKFEGDQQGFPYVAEMANYLERYAKKFKLNICEQAKVDNLTHLNGLFIITLSSGRVIQAKTVINATGANQISITPNISSGFSENVRQLTADIHSFDNIPAGQRVLVVGGGASGRQIAALLNEQGHQVTLSCTGTRKYPPKKILGQDFFFWLKLLKIVFADKNSLVAKIIKKRNPVPCGDLNNKRLNKLGVKVVGKTVLCQEECATFESGEQINVDLVVWCVGYQDKTDWLMVRNCVEKGEFVHHYGETPAPGLFIIGRKWLSCRASELVMGVERDVNMVVNKLTNYLTTAR